MIPDFQIPSPGSRAFRLGLAVLIGMAALPCLPGTVFGQVVPSTPRKFATRGLDGGGSASAGIDAKPTPTPPKIKEIVYIVLSQNRNFKSTDGKTLIGRVIAFDPAPDASGKVPTPVDPAKAGPDAPKPIVVKDGKVRLLVDKKPYEVPLDRLVEEDRQFVDDIKQRIGQ